MYQNYKLKKNIFKNI